MEKSIFQTLNAINVNEKTENKNGLTYLSWAWAWSEVKKIYPKANYEIVKFEGLPYVYDDDTGYMVYTRVTIDDITHEMWLPVMDSANNAMKVRPYKYSVKNPNFKYARREADGVYRDRYGNEQPQFVEKVVGAATMFDINKTIMRCLTKNLAMFGLGLYIYAGEDLPEECFDESKDDPKEEPKDEPKEEPKAKAKPAAKAKKAAKAEEPPLPPLPEPYDEDAPPEQIPLPFEDDTAVYCADCKREITPADTSKFRPKGSETWVPLPLEKHIALTRIRFGQPLCRECAETRQHVNELKAEKVGQ